MYLYSTNIHRGQRSGPALPPSIIGISDFLIVLNARYKFKFPSILQFQIALYSIIQEGYWTNLILLVSLIICSSSEFVELFKCSKKTTTDNVITLSLKFHGNLLVKHKNNVPSKFPSLRKKMSNWEEKKFKARVLLIPTPPSQVEKSLGGKLPPDTIPCRSQYTQRQQPESIAPVVFGEGCVCTTLNTRFISSKFSNKLQYNNPICHCFVKDGSS